MLVCPGPRRWRRALAGQVEYRWPISRGKEPGGVPEDEDLLAPFGGGDLRDQALDLAMTVPETELRDAFQLAAGLPGWADGICAAAEREIAAGQLGEATKGVDHERFRTDSSPDGRGAAGAERGGEASRKGPRGIPPAVDVIRRGGEPSEGLNDRQFAQERTLWVTGTGSTWYALDGHMAHDRMVMYGEVRLRL